MTDHRIMLDVQKMAQYLKVIRHYSDKIEVLIQQSLLEEAEKMIGEKDAGNELA